ncbi:MAG: M56 family metallopeptidase [Lachnospiraceae bacterium]|nr:M56 family metallopeptidase [Lachnospiraceae bacterium]
MFDVFLILWFYIALILLIRFCIQYSRFIYHLKTLPEINSPQYKAVLQTVLHSLNYKKEVKLIVNRELFIPFTICAKNPMIILPDKEYEEHNLYFILIHECTHIKNNDLKLKILSNIICCILWWNPVIYYFQKDLSQTLEMRCDINVTAKMSKMEAIKYLQTIVLILKSAKKKKNPFKIYGTVALASDANNELIERFQIIANSKHAKQKNGHFWIFIVFCLIICSYLIVPRGTYNPPKSEVFSETNVVEMNIKNTYLLSTTDGTYYCIVNDVNTGVVDPDVVKTMKEAGFKIQEGTE